MLRNRFSEKENHGGHGAHGEGVNGVRCLPLILLPLAHFRLPCEPRVPRGSFTNSFS